MRERKKNRLRRYDYSRNGFYYITICTQDRIDWFGEIGNGKMQLNEYGEIARQCWDDLPNHYVNANLDVFIIMPNHIHGIVEINCPMVEDGLKPSSTKYKPTNHPFPIHGLSEIIRGFKTFSSRRINEIIKNPVKFKWQRSFYDHIIRDNSSLKRIRQYIINNPRRWGGDRNNKECLNLGDHIHE